MNHELSPGGSRDAASKSPLPSNLTCDIGCREFTKSFEKFVRPARMQIKGIRTHRETARKSQHFAVSNNKKWSIQEEVTLIALFIAVGPDWSKMPKFLPGRQPSVIKCKLNNMLRYAVLGSRSRIDDVGRFIDRMASVVKENSYTLAQYHHMCLSSPESIELEPSIRQEFERLQDLRGQQRQLKSPECYAHDLPSIPFDTNIANMPLQYPNLSMLPPLQPSKHPCCPQLKPAPLTLWQPLRHIPEYNFLTLPLPAPPYSNKASLSSAPSPEQGPPCNLFCLEMGNTSQQFPTRPLDKPIASDVELPRPPQNFDSSGSKSGISAFRSLEPPYHNESCGYSLGVPNS